MTDEAVALPPKLKILHLIIRIGAPSSQYNEHCLPVAHLRDITICTYFTNLISPPPVIRVFEGDGTLRGFWKGLSEALDRPYDVIHAHAPQTGLLLAMKLLGRPRTMASTVYTVHNSYRNYGYRNRLLLYPVFVLFPRIVGCSHAVLESLPRSLRWLGRGKISIVQNGVDTQRVDRVLAAGWNPRKDGGFEVVSVARLIERKNPLTLLAAFDRYGSTEDRLVFVGDGELAAKLMEHANALEVSDRVTLAGMLSRDDVYRSLLEADVYVSTSRGEGLPVSVLEAMACEKPVILSDIPPHREIAGQAGFIPLIAPDDVDGFGRQIERFRRMTHEERKDLGIRCRQLVEDKFSLKSMHSHYERVYSQAITDASEGV